MKQFKFLSENSKYLEPTIGFDTFRPVPTAYEPMRRNRFLVNFPEEFNIPEQFVSSVSRPSCTIHPDGFVPREEWSPITIVFTNVIGQNIINSLSNLTHTQRFEVKISLLDPTGVTAETWLLNNCTVNEILLDGLSYDIDELVEVKLILVPSHVIIY